MEERPGALQDKAVPRTVRRDMNSPFLDRLAQGPLLADGAMGTLLFERGIPFERCFDELNVTHAALIEEVHREYLLAGAELIETNTFGCNATRLAAHGLEAKARVLARQGVKIARNAREIVGTSAFVAGSMGPLGKSLAPFGPVTIAEAEEAFRTQAEGLLEGGVVESADTGSAVGVGGLSQTLSEAGVEGESDPMYDQAVGIVLQNRRASISLVQRHLRIGYNRAARLLEQMEKSGVVSSMATIGYRDVLVPARNE